MARIAIVQAAPVPFDLESSLARAVKGLDDAADAGADVAVFAETWLGCYPAWIDLWPEFGLWEQPEVKRVHARYRRSSITVPGPQTEVLSREAAARGLVVVMGASERVDAGPGRGTLYNALLIFDADGRLVNHHRKLVPTHTERLVWGPGDGQGLRAVQTRAGRIGGLVCWEHWMPLARQALHASGEDIHVAQWPTVKPAHHLASQHYAFEARCFVAAAGSVLHRDALDEALGGALVDAGPTGYLLRGGSVVYGPQGEALTEPVYDEEALVVADLDFDLAEQGRMTLDVAGHSHRPDVFQFAVERKRARALEDDS